jgi:hypothetical protein
MKIKTTILLIFVLVTLSCGGKAIHTPVGDPNDWCSLIVSEYDLWLLPPTEVHVTLHVLPTHTSDTNGAQIDWGDGTPLAQMTRLTDADFTASHSFLLGGNYNLNAWISLSDGTTKGAYTNPVSISIGPPVRDYVDPGSGETIQIYDGIVVVTFNDWERLSQLEGDIADDPEVAAFLTAEGARSNAEWSSVAAIQVVLPYNVTVEEAVSEWPTKYPDLIYGVDPVYLIPLGE